MADHDMSTYVIEVFTSRNTSIRETVQGRSFLDAELLARDQSRYEKYPVLAIEGEYPNHRWVQYENGEKTAWSMTGNVKTRT